MRGWLQPPLLLYRLPLRGGYFDRGHETGFFGELLEQSVGGGVAVGLGRVAFVAGQNHPGQWMQGNHDHFVGFLRANFQGFLARLAADRGLGKLGQVGEAQASERAEHENIAHVGQRGAGGYVGVVSSGTVKYTVSVSSFSTLNFLLL